TRSGLPKRTFRGMSSTMEVPNHAGPRVCEGGPDGGRLMAHLTAMDGQSEAIVDLTAITANVGAMREHVGRAEVMAVVKSDGYGCGLVPTATAALAGGATWLGVGHVEEALALRSAGVTAPVLCLLASPDAPHGDAIARGVDLSAGT